MEPGSDITAFWSTLIGATMIALVHLLAPRFRFKGKPDNPWLPASAGVAIAYVFMDVFPHLAKSREKLAGVADSGLYGFLAHHVYLVALAGFTIYLAITLLEINYRQGQSAPEVTFLSAPVTVKAEIIFLVGYNFLIGYLLAEQLTHRPEPVLLFALAMAVHVAGIDCLLRRNFQNLYDHMARFALAVSVYAGWLTGVVVEVADATLALFYSLLAGGIIVLAAVYELPHVRTRRQYLFFCIGAFAFSSLVLTMEKL